MAVFPNGPVMVISGVALAAAAGGAAFFTMKDRPEKAADAAAAPEIAPEVAPEIATEIAPAVEAAGANADAGGAAAPAPAPVSEQQPPQQASEAPGALAQADAPIELQFSRGAVEDLRAAGLSAEIEKLSSIEGVAGNTKVWIARADIASAPGVETVYHVKGPLTCGDVGCDLLVVGASGATLLETVGEGVSAPRMDTLIINEGTPAAATWVFDGARYVIER